MSGNVNIYCAEFVAGCPNDAASIVYQLEIRAPRMIYVEHIVTALALHRKGFQEAIADDLFARFGGFQRITAVHQGISVETVRGDQ